MVAELAGPGNGQITRLEPRAPEDGVLICLLGGFRLLRRGRELACSVSGKAATLLATLALRREAGLPRETLLELLWPEQECAQATVSLNSLVYSLHRRLRKEEHRAAAVIYDNGCYALNVAAGYDTDVAHFETLCHAGNRLAASGRGAEAAGRFERALALYRGDLCGGSDVYAIIERERLRASYLTTLAWLADRAYAAGDDTAALGHALRLLASDPCREDAHRLVMRACLRRGERAQAMRQYRLCQQILREEFDAAPEALTTELFDHIRRDAASG
jgi:DNA-binding SARP family transcriptional activator